MEIINVNEFDINLFNVVYMIHKPKAEHHISYFRGGIKFIMAVEYSNEIAEFVIFMGFDSEILSWIQNDGFVFDYNTRCRIIKAAGRFIADSHLYQILKVVLA